MFCNNCGKELNNDEVICLACGADTSNQWYEDDNTYDDNIIDEAIDNTIDETADIAVNKVSATVKKVKRYIILAIIVVCLWGWYGTDSGKLTTARILVALRCYPTAYNIALKVPTAESAVFQQYTSVLRQINYAYVNSINNIDSVAQSIRECISSIDSNKYLLKDYEISTLFDIENYLNTAENLRYSILSDFTTACKIYDRLEYYDLGDENLWYAKKELATAKECNEAIERIIENSRKINCNLFTYTDEIQKPIKHIIDIMQKNADESETDNGCFWLASNYTEVFPNNYDSTMVELSIDTAIINELEDFLH